MFNGNYISISSILSNILKYPFVEGIQKEDIAEYLAALTRLIGAPIAMVNLVKELKVENYRAKTPTDLIYVRGIRYNSEQIDTKEAYIPMRYASDIYHSGIHCSDSLDNSCINTDYTYEIDSNYIRTSAETGYIQIAYQSIKTDEYGLPMIPDDEKFKQALKYYILWQYAEPSYYRKDVPRDVYEDIKQNYAFYVGGASNSLNMPSPDQMKTLENGLIRLIKSSTQHETAWRNFQRKEKMYTNDKIKRVL